MQNKQVDPPESNAPVAAKLTSSTRSNCRRILVLFSVEHRMASVKRKLGEGSTSSKAITMERDVMSEHRIHELELLDALVNRLVANTQTRP